MSLGEVLATARRAKGLTQEALAEASGLTQAALSRYEQGMRLPEAPMLVRLAAALGVTPEFLQSSGRIEGAVAVDAHMRRRATARAGDWRRVEAILNMYRLHARAMFEEVTLRADRRLPTFDPIDVDPTEAALLVRAQWRMPAGPVRNLVGWAESAGVLVLDEDFGVPRIDGLSQWVGDHPLVMLNVAAPTDRYRLTLAHELGHLCLHTTEAVRDPEDEANAFAAEFLMPAHVIRPELRHLTVGRLHDLKREWGVSMAALVERAHHLGTITATQRTSFYKAFSARRWRITEPGSDELAPERPALAARIATELAARGFTPEHIAHMCGFADPRANQLFVPGGLRAV